MLIEVKRVDKPNLVLLLVAILALGAAYYFFSVAIANEIAVVFVGIAVLCVILFLFPSRNITVLRIDDAGVFDARLGVQKIFWSDVEDVSFESTHVGNRFLKIHLREPEKYLAQLQGEKKEKVLLQHDLGFKSLNVDIGTLEVSLLDLKALIKQHYLNPRT